MVMTNLVWSLYDNESGRLTDVRKLPTSWRKPLTIIFLALIWVGREWVSGHLPYGGFQWSRLGQTQSGSFLANWAYWGGVSAVSLATAAVAATAVLALELRRTSRTANSIFLIPLAVTLLVPALTFINVAGEGSAVIGAVQGNANAGLFANPVPGSILQKHITATRLLAKDPAAKEIDFVVWPENSGDLDPLNNAIANQAVLNTVDNVIRKPLILGAVTWRNEKLYNSTIQFEPNVGAVAIYDKKRPVPFAEYVPDRPFWYAVAPDLIGLIQHGFEFGKETGVFNVAGIPAGSLICFEIAIDDIPHDLVTQGAQVILSQANNSDFGHTAETFQQEALARLQAIATGRSIVHVSTVGVTEIIRPNGTVSSRLEPFTRGYLIDRVSLSKSLTPAMRFYGWADLLSLAASIAVLVGYLVAIRKRKAPLQELSSPSE
jgi:apolipoprotein N-acyltransferase